MNEYELMRFTPENKSMRCPNGIDQVSETVGTAKGIIKWLLHNDESVEGYKLTKRRGR